MNYILFIKFCFSHRLKTVKSIDYNKKSLEKDFEDKTYKVVTLCIEEHNRAIEFVFFYNFFIYSKKLKSQI